MEFGDDGRRYEVDIDIDISRLHRRKDTANGVIANVSHHAWTIRALSHPGRPPSLIAGQLLVDYTAVAGVASEGEEQRER